MHEQPARPDGAPWCWNRPDFPTHVVVNDGTRIDAFGERRQMTKTIPFFSDNTCRTWDGDDNKIEDPKHPGYGRNDRGDYYPFANGFAHHCETCRHCPTFARAMIEALHEVP